ncbi:unnamed protein product [Prorocentrum cordatum]|uniref:Uncharacterized protein n=1 Tax=Prorocentrum cordatum TaxID=2364126 RepID=A0ABN9VJ97_9DINO|nr:unnamed protein product [Polarella glacialis]
MDLARQEVKVFWHDGRDDDLLQSVDLMRECASRGGRLFWLVTFMIKAWTVGRVLPGDVEKVDLACVPASCGRDAVAAWVSGVAQIQEGGALTSVRNLANRGQLAGACRRGYLRMPWRGAWAVTNHKVRAMFGRTARKLYRVMYVSKSTGEAFTQGVLVDEQRLPDALPAPLGGRRWGEPAAGRPAADGAEAAAPSVAVLFAGSWRFSRRGGQHPPPPGRRARGGRLRSRERRPAPPRLPGPRGGGGVAGGLGPRAERLPLDVGRQRAPPEAAPRRVRQAGRLRRPGRLGPHHHRPSAATSAGRCTRSGSCGPPCGSPSGTRWPGAAATAGSSSAART